MIRKGPPVHTASQAQAAATTAFRPIATPEDQDRDASRLGGPGKQDERSQREERSDRKRRLRHPEADVKEEEGSPHDLEPADRAPKDDRAPRIELHGGRDDGVPVAGQEREGPEEHDRLPHPRISGVEDPWDRSEARRAEDERGERGVVSPEPHPAATGVPPGIPRSSPRSSGKPTPDWQ